MHKKELIMAIAQKIEMTHGLPSQSLWLLLKIKFSIA